MDSSTIQGGIPATLAENLDARKAVLLEAYVDLSAFAIVLSLNPDLVCVLQHLQCLRRPLAFDTLRNLLL